MDELQKILNEVRKRPNMYLGKVSLERLSAFIDGYMTCLRQVNHDERLDFYPGFQKYVQETYHIQATKNWASIITEFNVVEEDAFRRFFELLDEFLKITENQINYE